MTVLDDQLNVQHDYAENVIGDETSFCAVYERGVLIASSAVKGLNKIAEIGQKDEAMMAKGKNVWVSPRSNGWAVQREDSDRASKVAPTKAEAERVARDLARNDKVELIVQGRNGQIQEKNSYGNDPCPPHDKA